jgi:CRP-like cAMP-binding protein/predicted GNAT family N-acyltransferase
MGLEIRFAHTKSEREAVYRLRYEVYIEEMGYDYPAADHQARLLPDEGNRQSPLLYAQSDGEVVGTLKIDGGADSPFTAEEYASYHIDRFLALVPADRIAILSRFIMRPGYRSGEITDSLLAAMIAFLLARRVQVLFCRCRPHLIGFYERLGFRAYADVVSTPVAGVLVPLVLVLDDVPYLERIRSRLVPLVKDHPRDATVAEGIVALLPPLPPVHVVDEAQGWPDMLLTGSDRNAETESIFEGLGQGDVARLLEGSRILTCQAGDRIVTKEHGDHTLFVVLEGTVQVYQGHQPVAVITQGSVFGEVAFLLSTTRTADVIAISETVRVLCLREKFLLGVIESEPQIAARFLYNLSRIVARRLAACRRESAQMQAE